MPKRQRTARGPARKIDKAITNINIAQGAATNNHVLYTAGISGPTINGIHMSGEFLTSTGIGTALIAVVHKPAGLALGAVSLTDGTQLYADDEHLMWGTLVSGLGTQLVLPMDVTIKSKRKMKNGDQIIAITAGSVANIGTFSLACSVFAKQP